MAGSTPAVEIEIALAPIAGPAWIRHDARRANHVVVVEQRLAHAHEHRAAHRVFSLARDDAQLRQDLPGLEAADAAEPPGGAEVARQRAADLAAETDGVFGRRQRLQRRGLPRPAPFLESARGLGGGQRDAHRLDLPAVGKLQEILQETIL
jgi:hypothetical protein